MWGVVANISKEIPSEKTYEYLHNLASILDGSSMGVSPAEVADACAKQHSANLKWLFDSTVAKMNNKHSKMRDRRGVNADDFAQSAARFADVTDDLIHYGPEGIFYAFDFMMLVAYRVHGELDCKGGSGYGDSQMYYDSLDPKLLGVINMRVAAGISHPLLEAMYMESKALADAAEERAWSAKYGIKHGLGGCTQETTDWNSKALSDLVKKRDKLDKYGLEGYFPSSIKRLQELASKDGLGGGGLRIETGSDS